MNRSHPLHSNWFRALLLTMGACRLVPSSVSAQGQTEHAVKHLTKQEVFTRLKTPVTLLMGVTDLLHVTRSLSRQTGVDIQPADYLRDRRLIVTMNALSGAAAITAVASSNEWIWSIDEDGKVVIARPYAVRPNIVAEMPRAITAALPLDIRTFLFLGIPITLLSGNLSRHMVSEVEA